MNALRELILGEPADVSQALAMTLIIQPEEVPLMLVGFWRAAQVYFLLNLKFFVGPDCVRGARVRFRWVDSRGHITTVNLPRECPDDDMRATRSLYCTTCGAWPGESVVTEIEIEPPGITDRYRTADCLHPDVLAALSSTSRLLTEREHTAEDLFRGLRSAMATVRDSMLVSLMSSESHASDAEASRITIVYCNPDQGLATELELWLRRIGYNASCREPGDEYWLFRSPDQRDALVLLCSSGNTEHQQKWIRSLEARDVQSMIPVFVDGDPISVIPEQIGRPYVDFSSWHDLTEYRIAFNRLKDELQLVLASVR